MDPAGRLALHLFDPRLDLLIDASTTLPGLDFEAEYSDFDGSAPAYGKELILVARVA